MSAGDATADPLVTLGRIAGVYGIKGWVKIVSSTRPIDAILDYGEWFVGHPGVEKFATPLLEGKPHTSGLIAQINNAKGLPIEDRDEAARLVGAEIAVRRSAMPPTEGDEIYWFDLIGMAVKSGEGADLGEVIALTDNGAQDILVVRDAAAKDEDGKPLQRLIPFVRGPIIESVNLETKQIIAHWQPDW